VSISERKKEIKRRRHRAKKLAQWKAKLPNATPAERAAIAEKIRNLTPGCEQIVQDLGIQDQ
jgi:hypothetical protein